MSDQSKTTVPAPLTGALSRTGVGRASRAVSHWFGSASSLQVTGKFLRRQLWAWPIIAAAVVVVAYWWVSRSIENAMLQQRANELNSMVDASVTARAYLDARAGDQRPAHRQRQQACSPGSRTSAGEPRRRRGKKALGVQGLGRSS